MSFVDETRDYMAQKSMDATLAFLEYLDDTDEYRELYADATVFRTGDSFESEGSTLHVDISGESSIAEFVDEIESSALQRITGGDIHYSCKAEGFARGIYRVFDETDAERVVMHSDDETYFGPSMRGIASNEAIRRMWEEENIGDRTRLDAEDYLWAEEFDDREKKLWEKWRVQRDL